MELPIKHVCRKSTHEELLQRKIPWTVLCMELLKAPPQNVEKSAEIWGKKIVWRITKKWKHKEKTASQKDLYHNIFWHIIKQINEKSHWLHFLHIPWKFSSSFGICFCSLCPAVSLRGFGQHGQGITSSPRTWPLACATSTAAPTWPWGWAGKDQDVFQAGMGLESLCVWGMHDLPPALSQYIPNTLGFKMKPLHLFAVIVGFL